MAGPGSCRNHREQNATFVCDRCKDVYCQQCRGETEHDGIFCVDCAVELVGRQTVDYSTPDVMKDELDNQGTSQSRKYRQRFWWMFVGLAVPTIAIGLFYLHSTRPVAASPESVMKTVVSNEFMVITALNQYQQKRGVYPGRLEMLVPEFWKMNNVAELRNFEYRLLAPTQFVLKRRNGNLPEERAGTVKAERIFPASVKPDTELKEIFQKLSEE